MRIPFDISKKPQIESGEYKVETKNHHPVRIICWNKNTGGLDRIVALVAGNSGQEKTLHYTEEGCCVATGNNRDKDLFIVTPEPEMTEFELALRNAMSDTVDLSEDREDYEVSEICDKQAKRYSTELIATAKRQLLQSGELLTQEHHEKLMETLREECKKDLPRWRDGSIEGDRIVGLSLYHGSKWIPFFDLEKLPGFKEEGHE